MFGGILHKRTQIGANCKKACASGVLETERSENVPKESHRKVIAPPTQTGDSLGVLGWVLAGVTILAGFVIIAGARGIEREEADNRRANSFVPQQTTMFRSPSDPIPRHTPNAVVDDVIYSEQNQNMASAPQQSALRNEKHTLDNKEVRKPFPVEVPRPSFVQPANPDRVN